MAITFPRAMPAEAVASMSFEPSRVDFMNPEQSGAMRSLAAGNPLWKMSLTIGRDQEVSADAWRAFVDSLDGSGRQFYGSDLSRPLPLAYIATGLPGGFSGTADDWSVNADRDVLTLEGLPVGFVISIRDYTEFRWGGGTKRTMVRAVEGAVADGDGTATFTVRPPVPTVVSDGAGARLDNPTCVMRLVSGETSIGEMDALHSVDGRIVAIQDLIA